MTLYFIVCVFPIHISTSPGLSEHGQHIGRKSEHILGGIADANVPGQCPCEVSHAKKPQQLI